MATSNQPIERRIEQRINFLNNSRVPKIMNEISYAMGK